MSGKIVRNVKTIRDDRRNTLLSIIVPSAGEGVRMKSVGPRSLISVKNITLMDYQHEILREIYPKGSYILVTGYEATRVMNRANKNVICIENERYSDTNVARSIAIGMRAAIHDKVLIVYGDLMFNKEVFEFPIDKSCILYANEPDISNELEIGCTISDNKLENMFYGLPNRWLSIAYLRDKELKLLKSIVYDKQKEKLFGFELINEIMERGGEFAAYCPKGSKCIDIDSTKDIEKIDTIC